MQDVVIVDEITKIYAKKSRTSKNGARQHILSRYNNLLSKKQIVSKETIVALDHLSFRLQNGDVLGIIGRNGAGKSTLLKIIAGIVKPTSGSISYKGTMTSILDFGTGFHPDLTGRENIFFSGSLLGMTRPELLEKFKSIVEFSEIEEFLDLPVKHYSSGMYLRLAFSVFTHLQSDILLLDEMIAVGDFPFRQKCYNQITRLARSGTTVIIVSHNPEQIHDLCNKCLWIENGASEAFGDSSTVMDKYLEKYLVGNPVSDGSSGQIKNYYVNWPNGLCIKNEVSLISLGVKANKRSKEEPISMTDEIAIEIEFEKLRDEYPIEITISIRSLYEAWAIVDSYSLHERFEHPVKKKARYICTCVIPAGVINYGIYQLGCLVSMREELIYQDPYLLHFKLDFTERKGIRNHIAKETKSIIQPMGTWEVRQI